MTNDGTQHVTLFVNESGSAGSPTLVLLHGLATTGWMWTRQISALSGELRVLVPDLPGHGGSRNRPWISLSDTVTAVADVIRSRTESGSAHIVGLSLGGYVAAGLAAEMPEVVASAIVSGVNVLPFPHPRLMRLSGRLMAPFMTFGPVLRANAKALGVPREDFPAYLAAGRSMAGGTFQRVGDEVTTFQVPPAASASPCRVLAVAGEHEHALIRRSLPVLAKAFPHGEARIAPGVRHAWNGETPELFNAMIRAHIADDRLPDALQRLLDQPREGDLKMPRPE